MIAQPKIFKDLTLSLVRFLLNEESKPVSEAAVSALQIFKYALAHFADPAFA